MALVPFGKPGPKAKPQIARKGRMPQRMSTKEQKTSATATGGLVKPAPAVDGAVRGHDPSYPRRSPHDQT